MTRVTVFGRELKLCWASLSECGLIMPTDWGAVSARKHEAQAQTQIDTTIITIVLVWFIICLVMFVLLFADQGFSKAAIELWGLF